MTRPNESVRVRLALALVAACTAATGLYAVLRVFQAVVRKEPDPALITWSVHAGFFWRGSTVVYVGGMVGLMAWLASGRDALRVADVLVRALPGAILLLALQSALVP